MGLDVIWTTLKGYPIQYGTEMVGELNNAFSKCIGFNNSVLKIIGKNVYQNVKHFLYGRTEDGYGWFGRLEYKLSEGKVAKLFPWDKERSIGLYSTAGVGVNNLVNIINKLSTEMNNFARKAG